MKLFFNSFMYLIKYEGNRKLQLFAEDHTECLNAARAFRRCKDPADREIPGFRLTSGDLFATHSNLASGQESGISLLGRFSSTVGITQVLGS